jgi:RHS repeat-associated protein
VTIEDKAGPSHWNSNAVTVDSLGREIMLRKGGNGSSASDVLVAKRYGPFGTLGAVSDPYRGNAAATAVWTTTSVDGFGRSVAVDSPRGKTSYEYANFIVKHFDQNARLRQTEQDGQGRLIRLREIDGGTTTVTYGTSPTQATQTITSPLGAKTMLYTDGLGRQVKRIDPDRGEEKREYDGRGNLKRATTANGLILRYHYDALDRQSALDVKEDGKVEQQFYYDGATPEAPEALLAEALGQRSAMSDESGTSRWSYNELGLPATTEKTVGDASIKWWTEYDPLGRVKETIFEKPYYHRVKLIYQREGLFGVQLKSSSAGPWQDVVVKTVRDAAGRLTEQRYGNQTNVLNQYDWAGRQIERRANRLVSGLPAGPALLWLSYVYDPDQDLAANAGHLTQIVDQVDSGHTQSFKYDGAYRLSWSKSAATGTVDYQYDQDGNITRKGDTELVYQGARPHAVTAIEDTTTGVSRALSYDSAGNTTNDGLRSYIYDAWNRVALMVNSKGQVGLSYDADGKLVRRSVLELTQIVPQAYADAFGGWTGPTVPVPVATVTYPSRELEIHKDGTGLTFYYHVYGGRTRIATRKVAPGGVDALHYSISDHLGSGALVTDASGSPAQRVHYEPYGTPLGLNGKEQFAGWIDPSNFYAGTLLEEKMELFLAGPRSYDSRIGRFLQPDPLPGQPSDPASRHPYAYGKNNPLTFIDPTGLEAEKADRRDPSGSGAGGAPQKILIYNGADADIRNMAESKRYGDYTRIPVGEGGLPAALELAEAVANGDPVHLELMGHGGRDSSRIDLGTDELNVTNIEQPAIRGPLTRMNVASTLVMACGAGDTSPVGQKLHEATGRREVTFATGTVQTQMFHRGGRFPQHHWATQGGLVKIQADGTQKQMLAPAGPDWQPITPRYSSTWGNFEHTWP